MGLNVAQIDVFTKRAPFRSLGPQEMVVCHWCFFLVKEDISLNAQKKKILKIKHVLTQL